MAKNRNTCYMCGLQTRDLIGKKCMACRAFYRENAYLKKMPKEKPPKRIERTAQEIWDLIYPTQHIDVYTGKRFYEREPKDIEELALSNSEIEAFIAFVIDEIQGYADWLKWADSIQKYCNTSNNSYYTQRYYDMRTNVYYDKKLDAYEIKFDPKGKGDFQRLKGITDVIKVKIPVSDRMYDPNTKIWIISSKYYNGSNMMKEIFKKAGFYLEEVDKSWQHPEYNVKPELKPEDFFYSYNDPTPIAQESKESIFNKLKLLLGASDNDMGNDVILKKLYRKKALEFHPDRNNGDGAKMSELNSLWSQFNATV